MWRSTTHENLNCRLSALRSNENCALNLIRVCRWLRFGIFPLDIVLFALRRTPYNTVASNVTKPRFRDTQAGIPTQISVTPDRSPLWPKHNTGLKIMMASPEKMPSQANHIRFQDEETVAPPSSSSSDSDNSIS